MSRLTRSTLKNPTKVGLLTLAKVSHKACSTTAVKKAPRTRQFRVACPTLSLSPQDSTHQSRPSHVTGRRGQAAHQEYLIQDPEVALGGDQGGEPVPHRLQAREARRGSNTQNYARRLRAVAPYEVEDEGHDQLGRLLYETDKQLGQQACDPRNLVLQRPRDDCAQHPTPQKAHRQGLQRNIPARQPLVKIGHECDGHQESAEQDTGYVYGVRSGNKHQLDEIQQDQAAYEDLEPPPPQNTHLA